jgi:hypothetical protein
MIVDDEEGVELPDLEAARSFALTGARSIASESILNGALNLNHCIEIADGQGQIVGKVEIRDAVTIEG